MEIFKVTKWVAHVCLYANLINYLQNGSRVAKIKAKWFGYIDLMPFTKTIIHAFI